MSDTDLTGMNPQQATEYVLAFITTLKQTEKAVAAAGEDESLWTRRVAMARSAGDETLAAQAQARLSDAAAKKARLEAELAELRAKVAVMRDKLKMVQMRGTRLVDTDLLLAQLEMVVGKKDEVAGAFKDEEAKAALDALKKKMDGN
jgi:hypothetical protein